LFCNILTFCAWRVFKPEALSRIVFFFCWKMTNLNKFVYGEDFCCYYKKYPLLSLN
jgi:hypothetical protein